MIGCKNGSLQVMNAKKISIFIVSALLSACGGDGDLSSTSIDFNIPNIDTPVSAPVNSDDVLRLFGAKLKEAIKVGNVDAANQALQANIDTGTHYYDGVLSVDFSSKTLLQAGYITQEEFAAERVNLAGAVAKAKSSIDAGFMNLGAENYLTGMMEYYLEEKSLGNTLTGVKETILNQAASGTNWNSFIDDPNSVVSSLADRVESIREVALALESLVDALTVLQEDGDVIPQSYVNKLNASLLKLKGIVEQLLTGQYVDDRAQRNYSQAFYNGLAGVALIRADEYFLKYNGQRDAQILPLIKRLADWMLVGGGAIYRYNLPDGVAAGAPLNYQIVQAGVTNPTVQTATINSTNIAAGFVEINIPIISSPSQAGIANVSAPFNSNLASRTEYRWTNTDVQGVWAIKYASHNSGGVSLANDETSSLTLSNIVNPLFAWLHKMDQTYSDGLSYKDAYWKTFVGPLLYSGAWNFAGSASGKFYNQLLYKMRYAWEWLGVNGSAIKALNLSPISPSAGSLPSNGWVQFSGDQVDATVISGDRLTYNSVFENNVGLPGAKALEVKMLMGNDPALSSKVSLFAGGSANNLFSYRANFTLNFINLRFSDNLLL